MPIQKRHAGDSLRFFLWLVERIAQSSPPSKVAELQRAYQKLRITQDESMRKFNRCKLSVLCMVKCLVECVRAKFLKNTL